MINKKISLIIILLLSMLVVFKNVHAESYDNIVHGNKIPGIFVERRYNERQNAVQAQFFKRQSDGKIVYCLEPATPVDENAEYNSSAINPWNYANITKEQFERASLIAYYGYGYSNKDHSATKWYAITQVMIHWTVAPEWDVFFTDKLWGNRITPYNSEIAEINALVNSHYTKPSFSNSSYVMKLDETIILSDANEVLSNFEIVDNTNLEVKKEGNALYITAKKVGATTLTLQKRDTTFRNTPTIYYHKTSQNVMSVGSYEKIMVNLDIEVKNIEAKLKVIKIDEETNNTIFLSGIKFKIFNIDKNEYITRNLENQIVSEFETDSSGVLITPHALEIGRYRLEEVDQIVDGYLWNEEHLYFEINSTSNFINDEEFGTLIEVKFSNKQAKGEVNIRKTVEDLIIENNTYTYEEISLGGVVFGLYAGENIIVNNYKYYSKDELIAKLSTDDYGNTSYSGLPLGKYYLKELQTVNGNLLDNEIYNFELKYKDQYTKLVSHSLNLENKLPKSTLEFIKIDSVSNKTLSNAEIKIFDECNNLIFTGVTDEKGQIIINDLFLGKFYIVESKSPKGYVLNSEPIWFETNFESETVKVTMKNELYMDVPNTGVSNFKYSFMGGVLIIFALGDALYEKRKE